MRNGRFHLNIPSTLASRTGHIRPTDREPELRRRAHDAEPAADPEGHGLERRGAENESGAISGAVGAEDRVDATEEVCDSRGADDRGGVEEQGGD